MTKVTIAQQEYERLTRIAKKYEVIRKALSYDFFEEPATTDVKKIIKDFRATGLYSDKFLNGLERGLKESSFFKKS